MKKILCIDAGAIRGIAVCSYLYNLDIFLHENGSSLFDYFDMFVGSSIGALIISAIVYEKMSGKELLYELFSDENIHTILSGSQSEQDVRLLEQLSKYPSTGKTSVIKKYTGNKNIQDSNGKDVVMLAVKLSTKRVEFSSDRLLTGSYESIVDEPCISLSKEPLVFRSWSNENYKLSEVCDASSAAPVYFPASYVHINQTENSLDNFQSLYTEGIQCIDGGVASSDPTMTGYIEALSKYGIKEDIRILSIGTGLYRSNGNTVPDDIGLEKWIEKGDLLGLLVNQPRDLGIQNVRKLSSLLGHKYLRVNGYVPDLSFDNVSASNINVLKRTGEEWYGMFESEFLELIYNESNFNKILKKLKQYFVSSK